MKSSYLKYILLTLLFFILGKNALYSRHIIGGVVYYEYQREGLIAGTKNYEFTFKMYRDCGPNGGADFDGTQGNTQSPFIAITVYEKIDGGYRRRDNLSPQNLTIRSINKVLPPEYPCMTLPPNICVQEGVYEFSIPNLPIGDYLVVYQRCCRNNSISNLVNPGSTGATFAMELTAEAMTLNNSSPVFKAFPPTVICANEPINFDHSAIDKDDNQLVYEFCTPFDGGGQRGLRQGELATGCDGVAPSPACPPPFNFVAFSVPTYTPSKPMAGNPIVAIDPTTGLITGVPELEGQFVVGVCVAEYDRMTGKLLSRVFRDFQFNVANCIVQVQAAIQKDTTYTFNNWGVNACGNFNVDFLNESYEEKNIQTYFWEFDLNNGKKGISTLRNASITFPGIGTYKGKMILNRGTKCTDSARITVNVFPDIEAKFEHKYDTCVAGDVLFTNFSRTGAPAIKTYEWDFGDGNKSILKDVKHLYKAPGEYSVKMTVTDVNSCKETVTKKVRWFPVPPLIVIQPSSKEGCAPQEVIFNNLSKPIDDNYKIEWDFGDGTKGNQISPKHTYDKSGTYSVMVKIQSPIGCKTEKDFKSLIRIYDGPKADFTFNPEKPNSFNNAVQFTDASKDAIFWKWNFGKLGESTKRNPLFTFKDTGRHEIKLVVSHQSGCQDTMKKVIDLFPEVIYHLPNAFTPNGDGTNDIFKGVGVLYGVSDFKFTIWNRWGERIFETDDPDNGWNGRKNNSGDLAPAGVYLYYVTYKGPRGTPYSFKGYATLVK